MGRHDPQFKGKGNTPQQPKGGKGGGAQPKGSGGQPKAASQAGGKASGTPKGNSKGGNGGQQNSPTPAKLPDTAVLDSQGRRWCYAHIHGKCSDPNCKLSHEPETPASQKKRIADEKKMAAAKEKAGGKGGGKSSPGPKAAAKAATKAAAK